MVKRKRDPQRLRDLLGAGADIAGNAATSLAIGYLAAGDTGAIAGLLTGTLGPLAANVLRLAGTDVSLRYLSPREQTRIGAVLSLAAVEVQKRLDEGQEIRDDVSEAKLAELLEGSLLAARNSFEERKIPLLARLLENSLFSRDHMGDLIEALMAAENLSYRQLLVIAVIGQNCAKTGFDSIFGLKTEKLNTIVFGVSESRNGVLYDLWNLYHLGMFDQKFMHGDRVGLLRSTRDIIPGDMTLSPQGHVIFGGLRLDLLGHKEIGEIISLMMQPKIPASTNQVSGTE